MKARSDVSKLTAEQLLRKDLKIVNYILVPSFPILAKVSFIKYIFIQELPIISYLSTKC